MFVRIRSMASRIRGWLSRRREDRDFEQELSAHLEMLTHENILRGMPVEEATRAARVRLGGVTQLKETNRELRGLPSLETFFQDSRFAFRMLARKPGFTAIVIVTLALGIGANTAIFSYVNAWVIKPLRYPQSERLVELMTVDTKKGLMGPEVRPADFLDLQRETSAFQNIAAWSDSSFNLTGDGTPNRVDGAAISWNFFDVLGVHPFLGRSFHPEEDRPGASHVAIISRGLWASRYAADPQIVGRIVTVNATTFTIVGVMPADFQFPLTGNANLWLPLALPEAGHIDRNFGQVSVIGRLKAATNQRETDAQLAAIGSQIEIAYPKTNTNISFVAHPLHEEITQNSNGNEIMICFWIVSLVLLIACANVANLMLARATYRTREIALRGALGATRGRLIRQLMTESLLLYSLGGGAGVLASAAGIKWIESAIPASSRPYLINSGHATLDATTLGYTLGIALLCGLIFGLAPAFEGAGLDLNRALKEDAGQVSGSRRTARIRRFFVAAEIALAVVVLICTTLLAKSFIRLKQSDPGFHSENVVVAQVELPSAKYTRAAQIETFYNRALERIRALPEVDAVGASEVVPFTGAGEFAEIKILGQPSPAQSDAFRARYAVVTPAYFTVMGIAILRGRAFQDQDAPGGPSSVIINETLAKSVWPKEDPLGQKIQVGSNKFVGTVVGVVRDVKLFKLTNRPGYQVYLPFAQAPTWNMGIVVHSSGNHAALAAEIRNAVAFVDGDQPVSRIRTLKELVAERGASSLIVTVLMTFFGSVALFLGAIGVYSLTFQTVSQRTHEMGIRMALGAQQGQVVRLIMSQGMKLTVAGIAIGMLVAFATTRFLASLLYEITPGDAQAFAIAGAVFAAVALIACYIPARRATRIDPLVALRYE